MVILQKRNLVFILALMLAACGGGGGGGSGDDDGPPLSDLTGRTDIDTTTDTSGDTDNNNGDENPPTVLPPIIVDAPSEDFLPKSSNAPTIGYPVKKIAGTRYTIEIDGKDYALTSSGRDQAVIDFNIQNTGAFTEARTGMESKDVLSLAVVRFYAHGDERNQYNIGISGNWTENVPASGNLSYEGDYTRISQDGSEVVTTQVAMDVQFDNILRSIGYSLPGSEEVEIVLHELNGNAISGSIFDDNNFGNDASFGLFGAGAQTIAGGYSNGFGAGLLHVKAK